MAESYNKWERFYHRLNLIFNGIVAASLIPFAFVFLETQREYPEGPLLQGSQGLIVKVIMVALSAAIVAYGQWYGKQALVKVRAKEGITDRLSVYLRQKVKVYALLESAAILACVGLYMSKDQLFSFIYVFVLFVFSLGRPTFERVARETGVPEGELKSWGASS